MTYHFYVGNDNGNSEHDLIIDGRLIRQPNVNCRVDVVPWSEEQIPESFMVQLQSQLVVTVDSPSVRPGMYAIGEYALRSGQLIDNLQIGLDLKSDMDLPIVNTLAQIAAVAVQRAYEDDKRLPDELAVEVDMATALPVTQHNDENAARFERRFMKGTHRVTVHAGLHRIHVGITFPYTKVIPEATPVIFTLQKDEEGHWRKGEMFDAFIETYGLDKKLNGSYFKDKRILHVDIGDGSTEYPITEGNKFLRPFAYGSHHGVGYAIEEALPTFNRLIQLPDSPRQFFSDVLKNSAHRYYARARETLRRPLESQSRQVVQHVKKQLTRVRGEVDLLCVYGGGSILMHEYLYPELKAICDVREMKLLYVPAEYAVQLNAMGLDAFVRGKIYEALKGKVVQPA